MIFPWNERYARLWKLLGLFLLVTLLLAFGVFLGYELVGWKFCEAMGIQGCSTLSFYMVVNYGAETVTRWTLIVMAAVVLAGLGFIAHWRQVENDYKHRIAYLEAREIERNRID